MSLNTILMLVYFLFINPGDIIKMKVIQNIFLSFILAPPKKKIKVRKKSNDLVYR